MRHLRVFVAVAREQSFRRAAELLYVSPASVSETVRSLERELGGPLLIRTSRRVELTDAGRALYAEAGDIVARLDRLRTETRASLGGTDTTLLLGEPVAAHDRVMTRIIDIIERATSRVVRPVELSTPDGVDALRTGEIDLAVVLTPLLPEQDDVVSTVAAVTEPLGVFVPPGHRLHVAPRIGPDDLRGQEVFVLPRSSAPGYLDHLAAGLAHHHPGAFLRDTLSTRAAARAATRRHLVLATEARRDRLAADVRWQVLAGGRLRKTTSVAARADDDRPWIHGALRAVKEHRAAGARAIPELPRLG